MKREAAQSIEKIGGADFLVRIIFRQNASWQGEVHWLNTGQKRCFRSFIELALLLHQSMEQSAYPRGGHSFPSWESLGVVDREEKVLQP